MSATAATVEQMVTELPTVTTAELSDIVMAVQGYVSPMSLGTSVQETWQQVFNLFNSNTILTNAGNPNGALAGQTFQLCWDSANLLLWVCTVTGTASTAVWTKSISLTAGTGIAISQSGNNITISNTSEAILAWNLVSGSTQTLASNNAYIANSGGLTTFTLPATSHFGDIIYVTGMGAGTSWEIVYGSGQYIQVGSVASTTTTGNVASTNTFDAINMVCTVANTSWQAFTGTQGNLTIV